MYEFSIDWATMRLHHCSGCEFKAQVQNSMLQSESLRRWAPLLRTQAEPVIPDVVVFVCNFDRLGVRLVSRSRLRGGL